MEKKKILQASHWYKSGPVINTKPYKTWMVHGKSEGEGPIFAFFLDKVQLFA